MIKSTIIFTGLITVLLLSSCQRPYLNPKKESGISPVFTGGFNFKRQNFLDVPLNPPFQLIDDLGMRGQSTSNPCLIGNSLYMTTYDGYLCKVDGKNLDETANYKISDGITAAPTYYDRYLFIASESGRYGLTVYDILDAKIIWEKSKMYSSSSPIAAMNMVFHASHDGKVRAFNQESSEQIWLFETGSKIVSDMVFANSNLYLATQTGDIYKLDASSGAKFWKRSTGRTLLTTPALTGNGILVFTAYQGDLIWVDGQSGNIILDEKFEAHFYISPSVDESFAYLTVSNGRVLAMNLSDKEIAWETSIKGPCIAPLLVTRDYIFAGTARRLMYCLNKHDGEIVQEFSLEGRPRSTPVALDGKLIFGTEYARFSALAPGEGDVR